MHIRIILTNGETRWVWSYSLDPVSVNLTPERNCSTPVKEEDVGAVVSHLLYMYDIISLVIE